MGDYSIEYPVKPGESLRLIVTETHDQDGNSVVSVSSMGCRVPMFYAVGLLHAASLGLASEATDENGSAWLGDDNENS